MSAAEIYILDVRAWMREDMLWLNDDKTEFLLTGTHQQLAKVWNRFYLFIYLFYNREQTGSNNTY